MAIDFGKYKKSKMSDKEKSSKLRALDDLRGEMGKLMADGLKGAKKVTVASPDKAGLEMGLEKAKEMIHKSPDGMHEEMYKEEESPEEESKESSEEEASEGEEESPEIAGKEVDVAEHEIMEHLNDPAEIDELIRMLQDKKAKLQ